MRSLSPWDLLHRSQGQSGVLIEHFGLGLTRVLGEHNLGKSFVGEHSARAFHGCFDHADDDFTVLGAEGTAGDQAVDEKFEVEFAEIFGLTSSRSLLSSSER